MVESLSIELYHHSPSRKVSSLQLVYFQNSTCICTYTLKPLLPAANSSYNLIGLQFRNISLLWKMV